MKFEPDYTRLADAAWNRSTDFIPLYEHNICYGFFDKAEGRPSSELLEGDAADQKEFFRRYSGFVRRHGYDCVPLECGVVELVQGGRGITGQSGPLIQSMVDLDRFPWETAADRFFELFGDRYAALAAVMPPGMKAVGGIGYGVFETAQDFVPFTQLSYLLVDDPELFARLFDRIGEMMAALWKRLIERFGDMFALCRSGDDLGFKTSTLLPPEVIRTHVIPQYAKIAAAVHSSGKPFLLHSCGNIFSVMDDIIAAGIDAKHSNEDAIAPFGRWVELYGDRIGNFGGFDLNVLCLEDERTIREYVTEVLHFCDGRPGIAVGSGNQIADYVPPEGFLAMVEAVQEFRNRPAADR